MHGLSKIYYRSISSTFYAKLLCAQIPKVPKKTNNLTVFFYAFGICAQNMLVKATQDRSTSVIHGVETAEKGQRKKAVIEFVGLLTFPLN